MNVNEKSFEFPLVGILGEENNRKDQGYSEVVLAEEFWSHHASTVRSNIFNLRKTGKANA